MNIKQDLNDLSGKCLAVSESPGDFNGEDLVNALTILTHVADSMSWVRKDFEKFTFKQRSILAKEFAKNLRQSLTLYTGIDPYHVARGSWPEIITERNN